MRRSYIALLDLQFPMTQERALIMRIELDNLVNISERAGTNPLP
jgi:hypothetical protein